MRNFRGGADGSEISSIWLLELRSGRSLYPDAVPFVEESPRLSLELVSNGLVGVVRTMSAIILMRHFNEFIIRLYINSVK